MTDQQEEGSHDGLTLEDIAGPSHRQLIESQLAAERDAKDSLEQRGQGVITSSGVLATLLFGLAAFAVGAGKIPVDFAERSFLVLSLALFVLACGFAAITAIPALTYLEAGQKPLDERVSSEGWYSTKVLEAYRRDAKIEVDIIKAARTANGAKAHWLRLAVWLEVAALASLAFAVGLAVARVH
jgi:hypothetical protein